MATDTEAKAGTRRKRVRAIVGGAFFGFGLVGAALAVVMIWEQRAGESIHQGLIAETRNALVGGQYRVALLCTTLDNRVSYYARARDSKTAHEALRWTLPVCELKAMSSQAPPGRDQAGYITDWYRGDFNCPANYHRRSVSLSAPSLDAAVAGVAAGLRDCRIEYVDQTHCPLTRPGCQRAGEDFRESGHTMAIRATR